MTGFIVRRLLSSVLVVILTSMFVFVLFFKGLGDSPARNYCEKLGPGKCTTEKLNSIKHQMGFDKSLVSNYSTWAKGVFVGRHNVYDDGKLYDCPAPCLGISITTGDTVWHDLKQKYPATMTLAIGGSALYLVIGVVLGALAARWRGTAADRLLVGGTLIVSSIPFYVIALLAWIYLSLQLRIFPDDGLLPDHAEPRQDDRLDGSAMARDRADELHVVRPVHPRSDGGDPQRGLHPHRAGQGRPHEHRAVQTRLTRRDRPGDHDLRSGLRHASRRARSSPRRSTTSTASGTGACRRCRRRPTSTSSARPCSWRRC